MSSGLVWRPERTEGRCLVLMGLAQQQAASEAVTGDMPMSPVTASVWGRFSAKVGVLPPSLSAFWVPSRPLMAGLSWPALRTEVGGFMTARVNQGLCLVV